MRIVNVKLGKLGRKRDPRNLKYKDFRTSAMPVVPNEFGHQLEISDGGGMLGNGPDDTVFKGFQGAGCCTCSAAGHETELWTAEGSTKAKITGKEIIALYEILCPGYNPKTGDNDNGCVILDVLNYRQKTGFKDANGIVHKIGAFLELDETNIAEVMEAMYIFDDVEIGIQFPDSAMTQFAAGRILIRKMLHSSQKCKTGETEPTPSMY